MKFIFNRRTRKERSSGGHLVEDASDAPHVDRRRVLGRAEEDVRRPIPEGHYLVRICLRRYGLGAGETEISQLKKNDESFD